MTDDFLAEQVQLLRVEHPNLCCRPNHSFTHVCVRMTGHKGRCGWDDRNVERRKGSSIDLQALWTQLKLPFSNSTNDS